MSSAISALVDEFQPFARSLLSEASQAGMRPRITSTRRSSQQQASLYRRFLAGQSAYPVAPPGTSTHETGLAFDMVTADLENDLPQLGALWESWGGIWGGRFQDPIHFEAPGAKGVVQEAAQEASESTSIPYVTQAATFLDESLQIVAPFGFGLFREVVPAKYQRITPYGYLLEKLGVKL